MQIDEAVVESHLPPPCRPPVDAERSAVEEATAHLSIIDVHVRVSRDHLEGADPTLRKHPPRIPDLLVIRAVLSGEDVAHCEISTPERRIAGERRRHPVPCPVRAHEKGTA